MTTNSLNRVRALRLPAGMAVLAALVAAAVTTTAGAQTPDPRFQPWLGCWVANAPSMIGSPTDGPGGMVCVVPAKTGVGVTVLSVANGKVIRTERLTGTGEQVPKTLEGCPGSESSTWSTDNHRLLIKSEYSCGAITKVRGSGVMSMSSTGEWVQVEGTAVGQNATTAAVRYHAAGLDLVVAPGQDFIDSMTVATTIVSTGFATRSIRMLAGEPVRADAVIDVAKHVDPPVAEAWLNELGQPFDLNAKTLVSLADAGLSPNLIDLMVALSYPQRFAVKRNEGDSAARGNRAYAYGAGGYGRPYGSSVYSCGSSFYGDPWASDYGYGMYNANRYGYSSYGCGGYGYSRNLYNDYYYGLRPVIIISRGSDDGGRATGHAVNGKGYTRDSGPSSPNRTARPDPGSSSSPTTYTSPSTRSTQQSSGSSSSGDGGSSSGRTAKARPPL